MDRHTVLIISGDPLAGALLGAAVELSGEIPSFMHPEESARDALRRTRPRLVLIDCDHEESCSDEFVGPALMMQARVLLFRSPHTTRDVANFVHRLSLTVMELPLDHDEFMRIMRSLLDDPPAGSG